MAPEMAYHRGKTKRGEEPVSKHQIRSENGRWMERHGVGRLNPRRETKIQGANRDVFEGKTNKLIYAANKDQRTGKIRGAFSEMHKALDGWMLARALAAPVQSLHYHESRYLCMMCGLEKLIGA